MSPVDKITAEHVKTVLLKYWRYKRNYVVASEVEYGDIVAFNKKEIIEVEIKIDKYDLKKDVLKLKHNMMKRDRQTVEVCKVRDIEDQLHKFYSNKFYFCVLPNMVDEALKVALELNSKYGVMVYYGQFNTYSPDNIKVVRKAAKIHKGYSEWLEDRVIKRLCSEVCNLHEFKLRRIQSNDI